MTDPIGFGSKVRTFLSSSISITGNKPVLNTGVNCGKNIHFWSSVYRIHELNISFVVSDQVLLFLFFRMLFVKFDILFIKHSISPFLFSYLYSKYVLRQSSMKILYPMVSIPLLLPKEKRPHECDLYKSSPTSKSSVLSSRLFVSGIFSDSFCLSWYIDIVAPFSNS